MEMNRVLLLLQVTVDVINLNTEVDCVFTVGSMSIMVPTLQLDNSVICTITKQISSLFTNGGKAMH